MTKENFELLDVQGLCAGYGAIEVLKEVDLRVEQGELVTLIGPNGAGKTTLLNAISGLVAIRSGRIYLRGEDLSHESADRIVRYGISQVPEGRRIFSGLTVSENLGLGAYVRTDEEEIEADLRMVLELFPVLEARTSQLAGTLSGGEQQMLAIGRALMSHPRLLMLDEPSMGLAPQLVRQIFRSFAEIVSLGTSVLLVEQNARLALRVASRGYVIEQGKIVMQGSSRELVGTESLQSVYLGGVTSAPS